jgi:hypothetical protein
VHPPLEQSVNEQLAPFAQARTHPPAEQATLQVAPLGHEVLQRPAEHSIVQLPLPQNVRQ